MKTQETPVRMWVWRPQDTEASEAMMIHGCRGWLIDLGPGMFSYRKQDCYPTRNAALSAMRNHLVKLAAGAQ